MPSTNATRVLLNALSRFLDQGSPPRPWGVGYSGGRDSTVLLWALVEVAGPRGVVALHVDHGWRSDAERSLERRVVDANAGRWGLDVEHYPAPDPVVPTEDAARRHRYHCFEQFLGRQPGSPVWLAHHADDQAETVLMRLLKGRSWQGLGGMLARRGPFLRPFLGLRASWIAEVAADQGLVFHEDSTNRSVGPTRNYLRHRVFPGLERRFPQAVPSLAALADVWRQLAPGGTDPRWVLEAGGGGVATEVWDRWTPWERQTQLAAVAAQVGQGRVPAVRFLETLAVDARTAQGEGAGWSWSRGPQTIWWKQVVQRPPKEYFVEASGPGSLVVDGLELAWSGDPAAGGVAVGGTEAPWVLRSPVPGMRYASEEGEWGRDGRRRRLAGARGPLVLVTQNGLVRAVFDGGTLGLVWMEKAGEKLHNRQIFVTLTKRSEYERR